MTDLSDFLRARLDEDEVEARKYSGEPWEHPGAPWEVIATTDADYPCLRIDNRRVLAEVDAKRRIVDELEILHHCRGCSGGSEYIGTVYECPVDGARAILRLLALPYVDHPDYQQEWKP